jgi:predicted dinucleotide-binding enzyme
MKITILGTGYAARTLGEGLARGGHDIRFGSRSPEGKTDLPGPVLGTVESIDGADLVVSALQASISLETLSPLADALAGRVLLDLGNAVGPGFALMYPNEGLGQKLQQALPRTRVVKSLNTIGLATAVDPGALAASTNLFVSGDDADAKALVTGILTDLGWPAESILDLGGIETARAAEHCFLLFMAAAGALGTHTFNLGFRAA